MTGDLPPSWELDRIDTYRPTPRASRRRFATYVHESGDVSLRVAPATLEATDRPGYELSATIYPGLEFGDRTVVRTVTTYESCTRLAREFMSLFEGRYDRPTDVEAAVEHAADRVRPLDVSDAYVPSGRAD